jgi:hypothetical protein
MKYDLHPALRDDIEAGSVWIGSPSFLPRKIVKIRCTHSGRSFYCEAKLIDKFYRDHYREEIGTPLQNPERAIFLNAWYRQRLAIGLEDDEVSLVITEASSVYGQIRACLHHPQVIVRLATILGLWSLFLAFVAAVLAIIPLMPEKRPNKAPEPTPTSVTSPAAQEPRQP